MTEIEVGGERWARATEEDFITGGGPRKFWPKVLGRDGTWEIDVVLVDESTMKGCRRGFIDIEGTGEGERVAGWRFSETEKRLPGPGWMPWPVGDEVQKRPGEDLEFFWLDDGSAKGFSGEAARTRKLAQDDPVTGETGPGGETLVDTGPIVPIVRIGTEGASG